MTTELLGASAAVGLTLTTVAALGAKALHEYSSSELEEYALARQRLDRFGAILDEHDPVLLGLETLRTLGLLATVAAGGPWLALSRGAESWIGWFAIAAVESLVLLLAAVWLPGGAARVAAAPILFHGWPAWRLAGRAAAPLGSGVFLWESIFRRLAARPVDPEADEEGAFADEIRTIVAAGHREGHLEDHEREMIEGVIELGRGTVAEVMQPRSKIDALEVDSSWPEILAFVTEAGRTRIPVYAGDLDHVLGVLYVKDLLAELAREESSGSAGRPRRSLRELLRTPVLRVVQTRPLDDMLRQFLKSRSHLAIVLDEYEATAGLVTIEDVLEEIVGEIVDEADVEEEPSVVRIDEGRYEALGSTTLDELRDELGCDLPETEDADTVAGLLISRWKRIPKAGEEAAFDEVRITVLEADRRRIARVAVELPAARRGEAS